MIKLDLPELKISARNFIRELSENSITALYGITDGKAVGTYVEQAFHRYLTTRYDYTPGNAAAGIDLPELEVDIKVTSIRQPQSSCPFRDATQKVYGLGYHLLIFVYEKNDDHVLKAARLNFQNAIFVSRHRTGDYQTTYGIREILRRNGNKDDIVAFLEDRNLPLDETGRAILADRIMSEPPELGYITISNALQWRLQYSRTITVATTEITEGVENILV